MSHSPNIVALMQQLNSGDERAVEEAFRAFEPYLRMVIRRQLAPRVRTKFDSVDVVQSVWADLLRGFRDGRWHFEGPEQLKAFLVRAARNRFLNRARHHKAACDHEQSLGEAGVDSLPTSEPRPDQQAEADELWEQMLALCPPVHRPLLHMRRQGVPLAELAARSGMHESSVRRIFYELARRVSAARQTNVVTD
jgi:RNA polymerase sigma factor (sigma-70 family)